MNGSCKDKADQMKILKDDDEKMISNHSVTRPPSLRDEAPIIKREVSERDPMATSASINAVKLSPSTTISTPRTLASRIDGENHAKDDVHQPECISSIPSSNHPSKSSLPPPSQNCTKREIPHIVGSYGGSSNTSEPAATSESRTSPSSAVTTKSIDDKSIPPTIDVVGMKRKKPSNSNEDFTPTLGSSQSNTPMSRRDSLPLGLRNKKMKATDCLLFAATLLEQDVAETLVRTSGTPSMNKTSSLFSNDSIPAMRNAATFVRPAITSPPVKKTKPLKKMVCEKIERSILEDALRKERERKLQEQQQEEERYEDNDCENNPKDADVLCGRGGKVNKHPGNIVYRKVVEYNKSYYQSVHKKHRILVSQSIVKAILNYGGRFMGQKGKEWTPICFKRAVQKTSQALRERSNSSEVPTQGVVGE